MRLKDGWKVCYHKPYLQLQAQASVLLNLLHIGS